METVKKKSGGLTEVIAGNSSICLVDPVKESLLYRGYSIQDLAKHATFEEVAWLLLHHDLPSAVELQGFQSDIHQLRKLSPTLKKILNELPPTVNLMDALRSIVSILGHLYPENEEHDPFLIAERVMSLMGPALIYWYQLHTTGKTPSQESTEPSFCGYILELLIQRPPTQEEKRAFEISFILYAEHEFNASTFTVKTIASTLSDYYSAICGGIGALRGSLHGGANEVALELFLNATSVEDAENKLKEKLVRKEKIMGFGHRVYTTQDPRSAIIKNQAKLLAKTPQQKQLFEIAESIENGMKKAKDLFPNLDFYSALVYHFMGIPSFFFTPLFAFSRITGWTAHYYEQKKENKLIRPLSNYVGPEERKFPIK